MLDLAFVRENLALVTTKLQQRGMDPAAVLGDFTALDVDRRKLITQLETLKADRNRKSEEVAKLKKSGGNADALIAETKAMREQIEQLEKSADAIDEKMRGVLHGMPNLPHESVPVGADAATNVEVRKWGAPPKFSFTPKPHWDLGKDLGILDQERGVKVTGARFSVYWQQGAQLERALANFMLDVHTREHGYTE